MKTLKHIIAIAFAIFTTYSANASDDKQLNFLKKGIVTIKTTASIKPYGVINDNNEGLGCIVDKKNGIILTSKVRVDPIAVSTYQVTLQNGAQTTAKLLYYDPWLDFAFLKIDPTYLPKETIEFEFSESDISLNQELFIIGGTENKQINIVSAVVTNLYNISGSLPQHTVVMNLNNKTFLNGAPIVDHKNKLISLALDRKDNLVNALNMHYIKYAFDFIKKGETPIRKHIGAIFNLYSLNDALKYKNFSKNHLTEYSKKYPNCASNAIQVDHILQGSPAQNKLLAGDIIWEIDGIMVGPSLMSLDMAMNNSKKESISLKICRNGEFLNVSIQLYNLEDHTIKRMVQFAGTLFFEVDDTFSDKTGLNAGRVTFFKSESNTTFNKMYCYNYNNTLYFEIDLISLNNTNIQNLDQLIQLMPSLLKKKKFTIDYINLLDFSDGLSDLFNHDFSQKNLLKSDISYDTNSTETRIFTFDKKEMQWVSTGIKA